MKKTLLAIATLMTAMTSQAQDLKGSWHGNLDLGAQQKLGIVFHLDKDAQGKGIGKMDIPSQSAKGIPLTIELLSADSVSLKVPAINMAYAGKLEGETLKGTFTQHGMSFPLNLTSGGFERPNRPQEPQPPYSYRTEEVAFHNPSAKVTLSGTLTYPTDYNPSKPVPVVLMVTGSGAQNRDEEVFNHKPFLVIADYLARNGIASLRYDDRGTGKSTGAPQGNTSQGFADDARAGLKWLKESKKFGKVGVLGHSEGGMIAFMIGATGEADFLVSMAGTGIKGDTLLAEQVNANLRLCGQPADKTAKRIREEAAAGPHNEWIEYFLDYDPAPAIAQTQIPVMAINGSKDIQVIAASNLTAIRNLLSNGNKQNLIKEYPGLNHLFQHCRTGAATEYYQIEETCAPEVLKDIAGWINGL